MPPRLRSSDMAWRRKMAGHRRQHLGGIGIPSDEHGDGRLLRKRIQVFPTATPPPHAPHPHHWATFETYPPRRTPAPPHHRTHCTHFAHGLSFFSFIPSQWSQSYLSQIMSRLLHLYLLFCNLVLILGREVPLPYLPTPPHTGHIPRHFAWPHTGLECRAPLAHTATPQWLASCASVLPWTSFSFPWAKTTTRTRTRTGRW